MAPLLAFLPSPLLGPSVWRPVARLVARMDWPSIVCELPASVDTGEDVLDALVATLPTDRELVLVPHSNAGAYVPELAVQRSVMAYLFVDAVLPPASGRVPLAPPALLDSLREKAGADGRLPPWTSWWDPAEVAGLFPDSETRAAVEGEQQRLPLAYFEGERRVPGDWDVHPGGYLAFGETYAVERDVAAQRGWPVRTLPAAGHLHQLTRPDEVAGALVKLLDRLGVRAAR